MQAFNRVLKGNQNNQNIKNAKPLIFQGIQHLKELLLSGLDSKKYQSILQFKRALIDNPHWDTSTIIPEKLSDSNREIDEYGEVAATRVINRRKNFSQEQIDTIIRLRNSGETLAKLADKFDCCDFTIRKILKKYNKAT